MAFDINTVTLVGNLTRNPEYAVTQSGKNICKFSIANNQGKDGQGNDIVNFFNITAWGKTAEICNQYLSKGSKVAINGKLSQNRYTDKEGQNRSTVDVTAMQVQFLSTKKDNSSNNQSFQNNDSFGSSGFPVGDSNGAFGSESTPF